MQQARFDFDDWTKPDEMELTVAHLFAGIGGGALGFSLAREEWRGLRGRFRNLGGIDNDPHKVKEFEKLTGAPGILMDLFTRADYIAFHGQEPPADWQEVTPQDLRRVFGENPPDVIFLSPPCKGFSGLLPSDKAASGKYQALNNLVMRGIYLCLLAWEGNPVPFFILENVPRIKQRGAQLLSEVKRLLEGFGYYIHMSDHDCGELGGLAQRRPRFKLVARHPEKVSVPIYEAPRQQLQPIKNVIGPLPMPGDPKGGPLHKLPRLDFITWLRLSLIKPGGDWKDIPGPGEWRLMTLDGREVPAEAFDKKSAPNPERWGRTFVAELLPGAKNYADVRLRHNPMGHGAGAYWVQDSEKPSGTITADPGHRKSGGASTVADKRLHADVSVPDKCNRHASHYRVTGSEEAAGTATGADHLANGAQAAADMRLSFRDNRYDDKFHVQDLNGEARTVTGQTDIQTGAPVAADLRLAFRENRHPTKYQVQDADRHSDAITTSDRLGSGAPSVADLRVGLDSPKFNHAYTVSDPEQPSGTVASGTGPSSGGHVVADLRLGHQARDNSHVVVGMEETAPAIPGNASVTSSNGPGAIADPRLTRTDAKNGTMGVLGFDQPAKTVTPHTDVNGDAQSAADVRMSCGARNGTMGVVAWTGPSPAVIASLDIYAGAAAIEDVRVTIHHWPEWYPEFFIISPWNAWHRPLTDWELAVLQSFPAYDENGQPLVIEGSRKEIREAIGNAVPPASAAAIAATVLRSLIPSKVEPGIWMLSPLGTPVWVRPDEAEVLPA